LREDQNFPHAGNSAQLVTQPKRRKVGQEELVIASVSSS
jgi:hypothetical protein